MKSMLTFCIVIVIIKTNLITVGERFTRAVCVSNYQTDTPTHG